MITALCIALCLSSAFAADAGKCSPKQYENVAVGKLAMSTPDGKGGLYDMVQKVTMDVDKKMSVAEIEVNGGYNQVVYSDAAKGKMYIAVPSESKCMEVPYSGPPIRQYCLDDPDLTLVSTLKIGDDYADTYSVPSNSSRMTFTVLRNTFYPVSFLIEQEYDGQGQFIAMQTGNMSIGIKDPSIFNLPAYCKAEKKCTPAQYESSQIGLVAQSSTGSNSTSYSIRQRTSLDSNRNMTVIVQEISGATFDLDLVLYQDNTNMVEYIVTPATKTCRKKPMPNPTPLRFCEGDEKLWNITIVDSLTVAGQKAVVYDYTYVNGKSTTTMILETFEIISSVVQQMDNGVGQLVSLQYGNRTLGIKDESVFNIPSYC